MEAPLPAYCEECGKPLQLKKFYGFGTDYDIYLVCSINSSPHTLKFIRKESYKPKYDSLTGKKVV